MSRPNQSNAATDKNAIALTVAVKCAGFIGLLFSRWARFAACLAASFALADFALPLAMPISASSSSAAPPGPLPPKSGRSASGSTRFESSSDLLWKSSEASSSSAPGPEAPMPASAAFLLSPCFSSKSFLLLPGPPAAPIAASLPFLVGSTAPRTTSGSH